MMDDMKKFAFYSTQRRQLFVTCSAFPYYTVLLFEPGMDVDCGRFLVFTLPGRCVANFSGQIPQNHIGLDFATGSDTNKFCIKMPEKLCLLTGTLFYLLATVRKAIKSSTYIR